MKNIFFDKKSIGTVVATALLLIVAVVGVMTFQTWFNTFFSSFQNNVEKQMITEETIKIDTLVGTTLYVRSSQDISLERLSLSGINCEGNFELEKGINSLDVGNCLKMVDTSIIEVFLQGGDDSMITNYVSRDGSVEETSSLTPSYQCYNTSNSNTIGEWDGCDNMLIVNDSLLRGAASNCTSESYCPNGDESFSIEGPDNSSYTFEYSQLNIFTGQVTNMSGLFRSTDFSGSINYWDTSSVETMKGMFLSADSFNTSLDEWDTSSVENMEAMFAYNDVFNRDIGKWNVSNVDTLRVTFRSSSFNNGGNSSINQWDVSNVRSLRKTFMGSPFDQNIGSWNVSNIDTLYRTFRSSSFNNGGNSSINEWDVSNVTSLAGTFWGTPFDQNIGSWDVSNVETMRNTFIYGDFNQDISEWNVSSVNEMNRMFRQTPFNQDIGQWEVSNVTSMYQMFFWTPFDKNISEWNVSNVINMENIFGSGSLSTQNYDALLIGWEKLSLKDDVVAGFDDTQYCNAVTQRENIIDTYNWTINDGGKC